MRRVHCLAVLFAALLLALPAAAQYAGPLKAELTGISPAPIMLTPDSLAGLPPVEMEVTFQTSKGPSSGRYHGVLLWDVFQANKAFDGLDHNGELAKTFAVTAADGYVIAFSVGEIHPDFGNTPVILADTVDGKPVGNGFRIVVPGDTRGARNVRDVVGIELR